jgi:COMPASS component SWD3
VLPLKENLSRVTVSHLSLHPLAFRYSARMNDSDFESSRSPKRRRINSGNRTFSRYSSPDELAASSDHEDRYKRRTSSTVHKELEEYRRRSYVEDELEESPDELDHTVHTFYRERPKGRKTSNETSSREQSIVTARSQLTPEKKDEFIPYRRKMVLKGHHKGISLVKFSPNGRFIASCCRCHHIQCVGTH